MSSIHRTKKHLYIHIYIYIYIYIFQDGEVKCTLHIREGECEENIKLLLEKRRLWENLCASARFCQQRKKEKKQETRYDQTIDSIPVLLILNHMPLKYYPLYVYFEIKEEKRMEVHRKNLEKMKNIRNKTKILNDESMVLKIKNYKVLILWSNKFIITISIKGTTYLRKINPVTSKILHWKGFFIT